MNQNNASLHHILDSKRGHRSNYVLLLNLRIGPVFIATKIFVAWAAELPPKGFQVPTRRCTAFGPGFSKQSSWLAFGQVGLQLGWWSDQREAKALVGVVQILQPSAQFYQWVDTLLQWLLQRAPRRVEQGSLANKLYVKYRQCVIWTNQIWMRKQDWDLR